MKQLKLIIAGSRTINWLEPDFLTWLILRKLQLIPTEVVCGCGATDKSKVAQRQKDSLWVSNEGIDLLGEKWAYLSHIPVHYEAPDWNTHGKAGGPIRNRQMAEIADALLIIWDGTSFGSKNMKEEIQKLGKPVYEVILKTPKI